LDLSWPIRLMLALGVGLAMYFLVERRLMALRKNPSFAVVLRPRVKVT
jgi:hypothetical protein